MKNYQFLTLLVAFSLVIFTACKKEEEEKQYADLGNIEIQFDNQAGNDELYLGENYVTAAGDTVNFTTFNYFVSNFVFVREDGSEFIVPKNDSYFLIQHDKPASRTITIKDVPGAAYKSVRFTIGVDSLMSATPAERRPAVLDPITSAAGMYWEWNSGYIFVKVEGISPQAPVNEYTQERSVLYHVGGYGGNDPASPTMNNLKKVTLEKSGELAQIGRLKKDGTGTTPQIHVLVDILQVFKEPVTFRVADNPVMHWGDFSKTVANNYQDMFTVDHIHN